MHIDLHTHSNFSDGSLSPEELADHAHCNGLTLFALTDHDTISGLVSARERAKTSGITLINGVELSVSAKDYPLTEFHFLGLDFDHTNQKLTETFENLKKYRLNRNLQLVKNLDKMGIHISYQKLEKAAEESIITKSHFALLLVEKGYAKDVNHAFDFMTSNPAANLPKENLSPQEVINLIHQSGGIVVWAHPFRHKLTEAEIEKLLKEFKTFGIDGVEAIYTTHTREQEAFLRKLAKDSDLGISGGSDFHGESKPKWEIKTGFGNLSIPLSIWEDLKKRKPLSKTEFLRK